MSKKIKLMPTQVKKPDGTWLGGDSFGFGVSEDLNNMSLSMYDRICKAVSHRGYSYEAPENTLEAYKLAKENGYHFVECDVSLTSDGIPMLLHDDTIDRTSNGSGALRDLTYKQVRQYDFGSWKSAEYAGITIPTFDEFVKLCRVLDLHPYIELKSSGAYTNADLRNVCDVEKSNGMAGKVTYISFNSDYLNTISSIEETARIGYVVSHIDSNVIATVKSLMNGKNIVFLDSSAFSPSDVSVCKDNGIALEVWTVDNDNTLLSLDTYISGVTSNSKKVGKVWYDNKVVLSAKVEALLSFTVGYVTNTGGVSATATYGEMVTNLYKVKPNRKYRFCVSDSKYYADWWGIGYYNADSTFIKRDTGSAVTGKDTINNISYIEFNTDSSTEYVRVSARRLSTNDWYKLAFIEEFE